VIGTYKSLVTTQPFNCFFSSWSFPVTHHPLLSLTPPSLQFPPSIGEGRSFEISLQLSARDSLLNHSTSQLFNCFIAPGPSPITHHLLPITVLPPTTYHLPPTTHHLSTADRLFNLSLGYLALTARNLKKRPLALLLLSNYSLELRQLTRID